MSRSARNRAARNARGTTPRGEVSRNVGSVGTDLTRRTITEVLPSGAGIRRGSVSYGGAGERGYNDAWNRTPYFKNAATIDVRWSK